MIQASYKVAPVFIMLYANDSCIFKLVTWIILCYILRTCQEFCIWIQYLFGRIFSGKKWQFECFFVIVANVHDAFWALSFTSCLTRMHLS